MIRKEDIHIVLIALVLFIAACSPPSKKQQDVITPLENAIQDIDTNVSETVPLISDTFSVQEPVDSEVLSEPVPDVVPATVAIKPAEKVSVEQSQTASVSANVGQSKTASVPTNVVLISGGVFQMGNNNGDHDEVPVHLVTVDAFYIGKYEVSQKEYLDVMGNNPSGFKGSNRPVEKISWYDAVEYCNRLSVKEGLQPAYHGEGDDLMCNFAASGYRLPTEAEWEYAAGRGKTVMYSGSNDANAVAWFNINSDGNTHEIGTKAANSTGLYDMSGNVAEWCWDWYRPYSDENQNSSAGVLVGKTRVVRGGSWGNSEWNLRISARNHHSPITRNSSVGFRIARKYGG